MATATTKIEITAKDSTAAAFASVNSGLTGISSTALKVSGALSAIGATALVGSFAAFTKQVLDNQDALSKLSQKTGIAVESLAGLEFAAEQSGVELDKVAKATRAFGLLVAESADQSSGAAKKLAQLGLSYKDLKDLSPEKQLLALSDALSKFSKDDRPVVFTSIFGQKMADLIPLLANGSKELGSLIEQGKKLNPVTAQSAKQAELFNDQLNVLSKSVSSIGRGLVQEMIPGLAATADRMAKVTQESGFLAGALAGIKELFVQSFGNPKILGDVGQIRREIFKTQEVIAKLSAKKDSVFFDKNALEHEKDKLAQLEIELQRAIVTSRNVIAAQDKNTESTKKFAIAIEETAPKLVKQGSAQNELMKAQAKSLAIESEYIKLLQIERKAREDLLKPYQQEAQSAEDRLARMRQEAAALDLSRRRQINLEQAIELTAIARIKEKRAATQDIGIIQALDREIAARRSIIGIMESGEDGQKHLRSSTIAVTDDISLLWMQAGRNIQSSLANGIFNFFDDGLKGMLRNVAETVGRIASEFAALKLAQGIGLTGMFGMGGIGGTGSGSAGLSASGMIGTGFGATNLAGWLGGMLPGRAGAFLGGMGGGQVAGVSSQAALMGQSFAAAAGPAFAVLAAGQLVQEFAGNKRLGGGFGKALNAVGDIPILGSMIPAISILNGLFGHGPLKFRQQSLQGTVSAGGFDGDLTNVFRAKGGLLVGNKHKSVTEQLSQQQQALFDNTLKGFYTSARNAAVNLGLSTDLVDNFATQIQIKSEKGKALTEDAIADMLSGIGNSLAANVLPIIDTLRKSGEDSFTALSRINAEFVTLSTAAQNLGASADYAKQLITGMSITARTAFVDMAGGVDALNQSTSFFFENFLPETEKLRLKSDRLSESLKTLGLAADTTKDQFAALIQSTSTANDLRIALLNLAPAFLEVRNAAAQAKQQSEDLARAQLATNFSEAFSALQKSVDKEKSRITDAYNKALDSVNGRISSITDTLAKLNAISQSVKNALSAINPISLSDARQKIAEAIASLKSGQMIDIADLQESVTKLAEGDTSGFGDRVAFLRDQAKSQVLLADLSNVTDKQIDMQESSLDVAISSRDKLTLGFDRQVSALDRLIAKAQEQIDQSKGVSSAILSLIDAIGKFNKLSFASGGGFIGSEQTPGNPRFSDKDIFDFASSHSPLETYRQAKRLGISSDQIVASGKYTRAEIDKFLRDNHLPSFDVGGMVPKTGLALVHRGERVINPQQNEAIVLLLQQLIVAAKSGANYSQSLYGLLKNMTDDGLRLNTRAAA